MTDHRGNARGSKLLFEGKECRNCGNYHEPELPPIRELAGVSDKISIRCPHCRKPNAFKKKNTA